LNVAIRRGVQIATLLALLGMIWIAYAPGLGGGFIFDDISNIVNNKALHVTGSSPAEWSAAAFASPASDLQRPLAMLTFALNHYFTGLDPKPMKLTNLIIHCLNALLAFALARLLLRAWRMSRGEQGRTIDDVAAWFVAAAWGLSPVNFMGVLYVVQRMESLSHIFVFTGLLLYTHGRMRQQAGKAGWACILASFFISLPLGALAKESAVLIPLYALCLEVTLFHFRTPDPSSRTKLQALFVGSLFIPAILALAWLLPRSLRPGAFAGRTFTMSERLLTEGRVLVDYLHWTVIPNLRALGFYHDDYQVSRGLLEPPSTALAFVLLGAVFLVGWLARLRRPLAALGVFLFFSAHAITASFISLELVFEHRNYFASFGVMLAIADLLLLAPTSSGPRLYGAILAAFLLVFYGAGTWSRAREWSDPIRFARSEALKHQHSPRAQYDLARILVIQSNYRKDSPYWAEAREAIGRARAVPGSSVLPAQAALIFASRSGDPPDPEAWRELEDRYASMPIAAEQLGALAALTDCSVKNLCAFPADKMIRVFSAALSRGDNAEVLNIYGSYALNGLHDLPLTIRLWKEALRLRPSEAQYHANLIRLWIATGDFQSAEAEIRALEGLGQFGQNQALANRLRAEVATARNKTAPSTRLVPPAASP
jgi:protein O-mannosyl-transferase